MTRVAICRSSDVEGKFFETPVLALYEFRMLCGANDLAVTGSGEMPQREVRRRIFEQTVERLKPRCLAAW